jgi:zinc protease
MLRGTTARKKEQIDLALDQIGAKLEVETRAEALILRGAVLSSQAESFLGLLLEVVTRPSFAPAEILKLKSELISELQDELSDDRSLAREQFERALFGSHPYGNPIGGRVKDIERIFARDLRGHYDQLFRSDRLLIVGTGDYDPEKLKEWAKKIEKARPSLGRSLSPLGAPESKSSRSLVFVSKPSRPQAQIFMGQIGVRMDHPDFFKLNLANHAFGGGSFQARLMQELRVKRGWTYGVQSYFRQGTRARSWQIGFSSASKDASSALSLTLKLVGDLVESGITDEEFMFARQSLINNAAFNFDTPKKRVENTLLEKTLGLPDGFMKTLGERTYELDRESVNAAMKSFFKPEALTITVLGDDKIKNDVTVAAGTKRVRSVSYLDR